MSNTPTFAGDLLGSPNFTEILSTGQTGTSVTLQAPSLVRRKSGNFMVQATIGVLFGSTGTASCVAQVSGPLGSVGPQLTIVGSNSKPSAASISWVDNPGASVGQPSTYSLKVSGGGVGLTLQSSVSSLVVIEL